MQEVRTSVMRQLAIFSVALALLAAHAAVSQDVRYNFDKDTDFSKFKTYKWVALKDAPNLDNLRDKQIKGTVEAELVTKGLAKTDADTADLYVESAQKNNSLPTTRTGDTVRAGTEVAGTAAEVA
jgi:hypothetical protein